MNVLLVQPRWQGLGFRRKIKVDERAIHPLSLGQVAAASGSANVRVVDEALEKVPEDLSAFDVVGISANTFTAPRAYTLAERCRGQGVPVVLGGVHPSLAPEECQERADAVVVGDAEDTWPQVLDDLRHGSLRPRYTSANNVCGRRIPAPRRDLFTPRARRAAYCQVSRGCTNQCRFCYLQYLNPGVHRTRDVDDVYAELAALPERIVLFADDNLFCDRAYARALFERIAPLRKAWWIQAPTDLHGDESLLEAMARAGCFSVSLGFQTGSRVNLRNERILQNDVTRYRGLVRQFQGHGIWVDGTFIFGFDGDHRQTFAEAEEMIRRLRLDSYTFYFLTPYPGTPYYRHFLEQGRIACQDLARHDWDHVVVEPLGMTVGELEEGVARLYRRLDRRYWLRDFSPAKLWRVARSRDLLGFMVNVGTAYRRSPVRRP